MTNERKEVDILDNTAEHLRAAHSNWSSKSFCLYLHGRAHIYDTLIYHTNGYQALRQRSEYRHLLRRLFLEYSVLFYGYSATDPDIVETLKFIAEELGGAGGTTHYLLSASPEWLNNELLPKANVVVLPYEKTPDHKGAKEVLRSIIQACGTPGEVGFPDVHARDRLQELAGIFCSLFQHEMNAKTYDTATGAIVLRSLNRSATTQKELLDDVRKTAHVNEQSARQIIKSGTAFLKRNGQVSEANGRLVPLELTPANPSDAVIDAVEIRLLTFTARATSVPELRSTIREVVSRVMIAQGLTVARAFVNEDDVSGYDLERLVRDALARLPRPGFGISDDLVKAVCTVLREPDPPTSRNLFRLAHAAYALESVFLAPEGVSLGDSLRWKIFLDTNVVLRVLFPVQKGSQTFVDLLARCARLGTPLAVLHFFVEECIGHIDMVQTLLSERKVKDPTTLRDYVETMAPASRSPVLDAYVVMVERRGWMRFEEFRQLHQVQSAHALTKLLRNKGIIPEGADIRRELDTSDRETLWAELREWRNDQSFKGRTLRRNEATQIEWMVRLRADGLRSWFLSIDGQLRRALLSLRKGYYAGFVMTPTAWAMRLADLHWGEIDVGGFSAFMWSMAAQPVEDRAQELVLRKLLQHPEAVGEDPEWLREQVDDLFSRRAWKSSFSAAAEAAKSSADEEAQFHALADQILPLSVQTLLDRIAKKRRDERR